MLTLCKKTFILYDALFPGIYFARQCIGIEDSAETIFKTKLVTDIDEWSVFSLAGFPLSSIRACTNNNNVPLKWDVVFRAGEETNDIKQTYKQT